MTFPPIFAAEFATYLNYCRSLRFEEKPDYSYLRQLVRNLFHRQGFSYDYVFDWNAMKSAEGGKAGAGTNVADDDFRERRHTGGGTKLIQQGGNPATAAQNKIGVKGHRTPALNVSLAMDNAANVEGATSPSATAGHTRGRTLERSPSSRPQVQIVNSPPSQRQQENVYPINGSSSPTKMPGPAIILT